MAGETLLETDVLVAGAGPVGLALAIELGLQGRRCLVVEQHDRVGLAPRAKTTNVRSRELMRRWGVADELARAAPFGVDYPSNVVFATRLAGRELARFANAFYCSPARDERFPEHAQWVPQYKVEEVLRARVERLPGVRLRFSTRLESFEQSADGVEAVAAGPDGRLRVRAAYLVGADGARSAVRAGLDIGMEGVSPLSHHRNIIFHAPGLAGMHRLGPAVMYWLVNPEAPAVVAPLDGNDMWTFGYARRDGAEPAIEDAMRAALGLDIPIDIRHRDEWTAHRLIATRYRDGRVFLAGDACHLHPPFGGHGMNMGIGDAVDLGWKLAAALEGWGGPALLDSYEAERRQVHRRVVDEAVHNLSHSSGSLWRDGLEDDGPAGDAARREAERTILVSKRQEFDSLGVVLGSRYERSPVLAHEPQGADEPWDSMRYVQTARPGCRAPHAWLAPGRGRGASLFDHFAFRGLTLLATRPAAREAARALAAHAAGAGVPLAVIAPPIEGLRELYGADLALIRPDQYVAWRGHDPQQGAAALELAAGHVAVHA